MSVVEFAAKSYQKQTLHRLRPMQLSNAYDIGLAAVLLFVLPALAIERDISALKQSRLVRCCQGIMVIGGCLGALAWQWDTQQRPLVALGLPIPLMPSNWALLALSLALLGLLSFASRGRTVPEAMKDNDSPLPQSGTELKTFFLFGIVAGVGWELLYRGYLVWFLAPLVGIVGAVCISALAYGLAHGVKDRRKAAGSVASSFLFTIAFAVTDDLWWLMAIHVVLPMIAVTIPAGARLENADRHVPGQKAA